MRSLEPNELPTPNHGEKEWPWTGRKTEFCDSVTWPKISIVTPSYNQGTYLEETIRSVLMQGYPNLEYIVVDGGSSDESVAVINRYESWLSYWVSEPDRGQGDAINKGFARATGDIFGWINSDDVYEPDAFLTVARYFREHDDCQILYGDGWYVDERGCKISRCDWVRPFDRDILIAHDIILQPAMFWRSQLWENAGPLDLAYYWGLDWEWKIRATRSNTPHYLRADLARWRFISGVKTLSGDRRRLAELASITRRHGGFWHLSGLVREADRMADWMDERITPQGTTRIPQYPLTVARLALNRLYTRRHASTTGERG